MKPWWFCNCRSIWCWLDAIANCKWRLACDRHDRFITN